MGGPGVRELLVSAFLMVLSMMLTVFACTLIKGKNAWPLLPMMFYFFTPVPFFLCVKRGGNESILGGDNRADAFTNFGHFIAGMTCAAGPSMSFVLYHTGAINTAALLMSLGSAVLLAAAVGVIYAMAPKKSEYDF